MRNPLNTLVDPRQALTEFSAELLGRDVLDGQYTPVAPADLPPVYRDLLAHHEHMTLRLRKHFGGDVRLHVLSCDLDGNFYQRFITLTSAATGKIVEVGLVRIDFSYISDSVRSAIQERKSPLGDVLIQANVLRRIEPKWYYHFTAACPILANLGEASLQEAFGRLGTIYCDEQPAIELLEIVYDERARAE